MDVSKLLLHDVFNKIDQLMSYLGSFEIGQSYIMIMIVVSWVAVTFYIFYLLYQYIGFALTPYIYIYQVLSGDAMANQLMQVIIQVARKWSYAKLTHLFLPLGSKANISFSLGWVS